jgi:hypothetical protein
MLCTEVSTVLRAASLATAMFSLAAAGGRKGEEGAGPVAVPGVLADTLVSPAIIGGSEGAKPLTTPGPAAEGSTGMLGMIGAKATIPFAD